MSLPTILIADNHLHFRRALRQLCEVNGGFRVVAEATTAAAAVSLARRLRPQVVLVDMHLPDLDGAHLTRRLLAEMPGLVVVLLSFAWEEESLTLARQSGAHAYLAKDCEEAALFAAIRNGPDRNSLHPSGGPPLS